MAERMTQADRCAQLILENQRVLDRARKLCGNLDERRMSWLPADQGWGVGQVLEHLCIVHDGFVREVGPILSSGKPVLPGQDAGWKPSLGGRLLDWAVASSRRFKTSRSLEPGPSPRQNVVDSYLSCQEEVGRMIQSAKSMHWAKVRVNSPTGSFPKVNLGDRFGLLIGHAARHLKQIERLLQQQG